MLVALVLFFLLAKKNNLKYNVKDFFIKMNWFDIYINIYIYIYIYIYIHSNIYNIDLTTETHILFLNRMRKIKGT